MELQDDRVSGPARQRRPGAAPAADTRRRISDVLSRSDGKATYDRLGIANEAELAQRVECATFPGSRNSLVAVGRDLVGARSGIAVFGLFVGVRMAAKISGRHRRPCSGTHD